MQTPRAGTLLLSMGLAFGPAATGEFGVPLRGLSSDQLQRFAEGRVAFEEIEDVADGLGPVFNGTSCVGCHNVGATGGGSEIVETRFGTVRDGAFDPLAELGGSLVQRDGIGAQGACTFVGEVIPPRATIVAQRRATPLFGLGLVDAVPDETFIALAAAQARRQPGTAGRPNLVLDVVTGALAVGRFGWKSQVPNLLQFSADAYLNEMGITTPLAPDESCPQGDCAVLACDPIPGVDDDLEDVELFADFMRFLAPPPVQIAAQARSRAGGRRPGGHQSGGRQSEGTQSGGRQSEDDPRRGSRVFDAIGCASCHVRSLASGPDDVAALRFRRFQPYSDFLLHDMGSLGDGISQGDATGTEMRTAPLWGLRILTAFLHDGRARSIEEAILGHDGQARRARDRFAELPADERAGLLAFLRSL